MTTKFWIEKKWGDSVDNATIEDTEIAIGEAIKTNKQQHSIFWVGYADLEYVVEIHKDLDLFFIYGENQDKRIQAQLFHWNEVRYFLQMYFDKDFLGLKNEIESRVFSNNWLEKE
jgi:hypothetical protein